MAQGCSKYHNVRSEYNGRAFASRKEADHAAVLDALKRATSPNQKVISVEYQYRIPLNVNGTRICFYVADFYVTFADGHKEIQDTKGFQTPVYKLKKKLVEAIYGEKIVEF